MTTIVVKNQDEFEALVGANDFRISRAIVEGILKNLYTTKRFVYILSIEVDTNSQWCSDICNLSLIYVFNNVK